jgi:hypothetical protein
VASACGSWPNAGRLQGTASNAVADVSEGLRWLQGSPWAGPVTAVRFRSVSSSPPHRPAGRRPARSSFPDSCIGSSVDLVRDSPYRARIAPRYSPPAVWKRRGDSLHAVKMGYPAFWRVVLVSGAGALGSPPRGCDTSSVVPCRKENPGDPLTRDGRLPRLKGLCVSLSVRQQASRPALQRPGGAPRGCAHGCGR